jgi:hypothetical protein
MGVNGASGTKISLGTTATDPTTDTYTDIGSLESIGEFGTDFAEITFEDLTSGVVNKFKGARSDGVVAVGLGRDMTDVGQVALRAALLIKDDYNVKITYNDATPATSAVVTISLATPGVITDTGHGLPAGTPVKFTTTGALLTGLVAGTTYYVKNPATNTYEVAATPGGASIATSGTQSGVHTRTTVPVASFDTFKAKVMSYKTNPGNLNSVVKATVNLSVKGGSLTMTARIP